MCSRKQANMFIVKLISKFYLMNVAAFILH